LWWLICAALLSPHLLPNFLAASPIWGLTFYLQAFTAQDSIGEKTGNVKYGAKAEKSRQRTKKHKKNNFGAKTISHR